jgi:hypothetical protein
LIQEVFMAIITLKPGDKIQLQFSGVEGRFEVHYSTDEHADSLVIKETQGLSGNVCGDGHAVLYEENLGPMANNCASHA